MSLLSATASPARTGHAGLIDSAVVNYPWENHNLRMSITYSTVISDGQRFDLGSAIGTITIVHQQGLERTQSSDPEG